MCTADVMRAVVNGGKARKVTRFLLILILRIAVHDVATDGRGLEGAFTGIDLVLSNGAGRDMITIFKWILVPSHPIPS